MNTCIRFFNVCIGFIDFMLKGKSLKTNRAKQIDE